MLQTRYASFGKRFIAFIIDRLILGLLSGFLIVPLVVLCIPEIWNALEGFPFMYLDFDFDGPLFVKAFLSSLPIITIILLVLACWVVSWLYYILFESSSRQATPGKMMLGIFVTDDQGRRISFLRATGRRAGKVLSKILFYLGYIIALFTPRSQALHDLLASTLVLEPDLRQLPPQVTTPGETRRGEQA